MPLRMKETTLFPFRHLSSSSLHHPLVVVGVDGCTTIATASSRSSSDSIEACDALDIGLSRGLLDNTSEVFATDTTITTMTAPPVPNSLHYYSSFPEWSDPNVIQPTPIGPTSGVNIVNEGNVMNQTPSTFWHQKEEGDLMANILQPLLPFHNMIVCDEGSKSNTISTARDCHDNDNVSMNRTSDPMMMPMRGCISDPTELGMNEEDKDIDNEVLAGGGGGGVMQADSSFVAMTDPDTPNTSLHVSRPSEPKTTSPNGHESRSILNQNQWSQRYLELVAYKNHYGNCFVPHNWLGNRPLAQWVKRQRHQYKLKKQGMHSTLTDEREGLLEELLLLLAVAIVVHPSTPTTTRG